MNRQMHIAVALVLLIGCSRDSSDLNEKASSSPAKEDQIATRVSGDIRPAVNSATRGSPLASPPPRAQLTPSIATPSTNSFSPADSAQVIASSLLDEQAERELEGGVLSATTQLHAQYKSEERQDDWASFVEENLKAHFVNRRFSNIDVAHIGCKRSICELLAVTREISSSPAALQTWQNEVFLLPREHWWQYAQMSQPAFQVLSTRDGRSVFVTHLMRKP